jgi:hypothetical protein
MKNLNLFAIIFLIGIGGTSTVIAKGHDGGRADGSFEDPSILNKGSVAGIDLRGVGFSKEGNFLGVVDMDHDLTYGQNVVQDQVANDTRRVIPVVNGRGVR